MLAKALYLTTNKQLHTTDEYWEGSVNEYFLVDGTHDEIELEPSIIESILSWYRDAHDSDIRDDLREWAEKKWAYDGDTGYITLFTRRKFTEYRWDRIVVQPEGGGLIVTFHKGDHFEAMHYRGEYTLLLSQPDLDDE